MYINEAVCVIARALFLCGYGVGNAQDETPHFLRMELTTVLFPRFSGDAWLVCSDASITRKIYLTTSGRRADFDINLSGNFVSVNHSIASA